MNIYVAAHDQKRAISCAEQLEKAGHNIFCKWLTVPFLKTEEHTEAERFAIAQRNADEIAKCDALVLLESHDRVPGGKFVEAGLGLGLGKRVFLIGRRENMMMWHPQIRQYDSMDALLRAIH